MAAKHQVKELQSHSEFEAIVKTDNDETLVVIDFSAVWCGPCKRISPKFEEYSNEADFADVQFVKIDVDKLEETARQCGIEAMPTFQFYRGGKKIDEFRGADPAKLLNTLKKHA